MELGEAKLRSFPIERLNRSMRRQFPSGSPLAHSIHERIWLRATARAARVCDAEVTEAGFPLFAARILQYVVLEE